MATVVNEPEQRQKSANHRAESTRTALKSANGSAGGIIGILTAAALGTIPITLTFAALMIFGVIMISALIIAGIFTSRR